MGSDYVWGQNSIRDVLLQMITIGLNIADKSFKEELHGIFSQLLEIHLNNKEDLIYLDFIIKKEEEYYKIIGNNIVSALWLSGIIPKDSEAVMKYNECHVNDKIYTFNKKRKKLIISKNE